jgi:predicted Fe-S protein YdhL (DUF1289 family)
MYPRTRDTPSIDAPCVRNCCLDEQDICMGCGRSFTEIQQWHGMTGQQRSELLEIAAQRRQARAQRSR